MAAEEKVQTNVRLTPTARRIMKLISGLWGIAEGDVVEMLLRTEGARIGVSGVNSHLAKGPPWPEKEE